MKLSKTILNEIAKINKKCRTFKFVVSVFMFSLGRRAISE